MTGQQQADIRPRGHILPAQPAGSTYVCMHACMYFYIFLRVSVWS